MMKRVLLLGLLLLPAPLPALAADPLAEADYHLPPPASLSALVERPLFTPSRRGEATATPASPAPSGELRLVGAVVGRTGVGRALLLQGGVARPWLPGQEQAGWRLLAVEPGAVRLAGPAGADIRLPVGAVLPHSH
jgi:hypothetical protein